MKSIIFRLATDIIDTSVASRIAMYRTCSVSTVRTHIATHVVESRVGLGVRFGVGLGVGVGVCQGEAGWESEEEEEGEERHGSTGVELGLKWWRSLRLL